MQVIDRYKFVVLLLGCSTYNVLASSDIMNDFFPSIKGNLTSITWAHAINNQSLLNQTLSNDQINMIEADISLGKVNDAGPEEPIMAHPPTNTSDLSLQDFLTKINEFNANSTTGKKGVKLDFKTIDVFEKSVDIVKKFVSEGYPIWLNADILPGPVNATTVPVDSKRFLEKAKNFNDSILSIGWTTYYTADGGPQKGSYSKDQIEAMLKIIDTNNVTQKISFPVRAGLAAESLDEMKTLLSSVPNSTLTIWQSGKNDTVDVKKLRLLIATSGLDKTYIDVPEDLSEQLKLNDLPKTSDGTANLISPVLSLLNLTSLLYLLF